MHSKIVQIIIKLTQSVPKEK